MLVWHTLNILILLRAACAPQSRHTNNPLDEDDDDADEDDDDDNDDD